MLHLAEKSQHLTKWAWGSTSKEERHLVRKLDFFILTYSCLSYFFNYLDRAAFANAYVAGLKEALDLEGSQYNVLLSMASAGLLIGQIPHSIIIHIIAPRIWLSCMIVVWAGLTMASAACTTFSQLCAVRFFMGLAEACTYPACIYVIGSWYKRDEIAKRTALFTVAGQVGNMFAGAMMAAIYRSMDGRSGLAGWQWVVLIDGIITCPIAIFGFFFFPDVPEHTKAPFLSQKERELALARLPPKNPKGHDVSPKSLAKRVLGKPAFWVCCIFSFFAAGMQAYSTQGLMLLYLKFHQKNYGYSQTNVNTFPLGVQAIGIVSEFAVAYAIDHFNQWLAAGITLCGIQIVCSIVLLIPGTGAAGNLTALYLASTAYGINPLLYGWPSVILARDGDDAARSVIIACMMGAGMLLYTFWGIVMYPASHAPYWRNGYIAMICVVAALFGWLFAVRWLDQRTQSPHSENSTLEQPLEATDESSEKGMPTVSVAR
ncbi:unnamed protein product [Clonostachys rosea]|uniref:Major facilitator superfamily (MFS) profile domain-containing protein n=1 Tax=Bionectria ochroleuca TaxID=29856 RepID=A0ABY6TNB4_BIOOC|nr:unnamed protein product [Clonostachys rosea]